MSDMASYGMMMSLIGGFASFASLVVEIVFLVIVLGLVRRERPDAWGLFAAAIGCDVLAIFVGFAGNMVAAIAFGGSRGMWAIAGVSAMSSILHVVGRVLVVMGVARLARLPAVAAAPWP